MRRLYLQIYLAFVGIFCLFGALAALVWWHAPSRGQEQRIYDGLGGMVAELLPPGQEISMTRAALSRLGGNLRLQLTLWSEDGQVLAEEGARLPFPGRDRVHSGWLHIRGGPAVALRLPDGRWLVAQHRHRPPRPGLGLLFGLVLLAVAVAVGAYPVARRLTRRLERLRGSVEALGGGDLGARVEVEGKDEVAALAQSFNRAADRIERLMDAQRTLLASASHELRSPLARIRVAVELMGAERPELRQRVERDIAELDELIGELLLTSRLKAVEAPERREEVDLLALLAEEGARYEAEVSGVPVHVQGDARLLRRLVRNLLENARRHGRGTPIEAWAGPGEGGRVRIRVCDRGPGVPEAERDRIFEPFHRAGARSDAGEGVGLGLSLVRQIARHHGGDAVCQGREGGGTCFEVDLAAGPDV